MVIERSEGSTERLNASLKRYDFNLSAMGSF